MARVLRRRTLVHSGGRSLPRPPGGGAPAYKRVAGAGEPMRRRPGAGERPYLLRVRIQSRFPSGRMVRENERGYAMAVASRSAAVRASRAVESTYAG